MIKENKFKVELACRTLKVSKSGYYKWLKQGENQKKQSIQEKIQACHKSNHERYGAPKIYHAIKDDLAKDNQLISKRTIGRYMQQMNLKAKGRKNYKRSSEAVVKHDLANVLNRDFSAEKPNQKWVSDITYLPTNQGWAYLCTIMDLYSRKIIAYKLQPSMNTSLLLNTLNMALDNRGKNHKGLIFHSDQGSQYTSLIVQSYLKERGIIQSVSRKGNCWDNACAESFFKSLKAEMIDDKHKNYSLTQMKALVFDYIHVYYNQIRSHSSIGYLSPVLFESKSPQY
jgi:putative transposase